MAPVEEFAKHLAKKNCLLPDAQASAAAERSLRKLWELTELTASGFADEVAQFYGLRRLALPQLVAMPSLADRFSPRFLRDSSVFPFEHPKGEFKLAVGDPSDTAVSRAAEIVLGAPVTLEVASFEDIATVLGQHLGNEEAPGAESGAGQPRADDDIESLRDLASGAPV
ncbi:MAG TPA: type II/IV secretion system protein, partial [Methylocella sp.]|nr:type II/IV secretion system protein [Methylocella sp.]